MWRRVFRPAALPPTLVLALCAIPLACDDAPTEADPHPYEVIDLGTLGGDRSRAQALNDRGQVTGYAERADGRAVAFLWEDGGMSELPGLGGGSDARAINPSGVVAGVAEAQDGTHRAVLWRDGAVVDLGVLPGHDVSDAMDVDGAGRAIGRSYVLYPEEPSHAVMWEPDGTKLDLGTDLALYAMNANGVLAGCRVSGFSCAAPILWVDGEATELGGGDPAVAGFVADVNDAGDALLYYHDGTSFLWRAGAPTELVYPGAQYTRATRIADDGRVVGYATTDGVDRAFLWEDGRWLDLGALATEVFGPDGAARTQAHAINATGQVAGARVTDQGIFRAILWDPR